MCALPIIISTNALLLFRILYGLLMIYSHDRDIGMNCGALHVQLQYDIVW